MRFHPASRIAAVLIGAGVVFGLRQGLDTSLYLAIPAGILAYAAVLVGVTVAIGSRRSRE